MVTPKTEKPELEPLKITCTSTDCDNGLHCFLTSGKKGKATTSGSCRQCGVQLVDWERVHKKDTSDVQYTFKAMKHELIRHHFWHVEIDERAINYARRKGILGLQVAVSARLRTSVGAITNPREGRQTPMEGSGNPVHYAQHATASCCRKCIAYWHGIPHEKALTDRQIEYLSELAMLYLMERISGLTKSGEYVPYVRRPKENG